MEAYDIPGAMLAPTIFFKVGARLAQIFGWKTRIVTLLLAGFSIVTVLVLHLDITDSGQAAHFLKNLAIAGGLVMLALYGAGRASVDNWLTARRVVS